MLRKSWEGVSGAHPGVRENNRGAADKEREVGGGRAFYDYFGNCFVQKKDKKNRKIMVAAK